MELSEIAKYLVAILSLALLAAGWMAVQILAKRLNVKNHIDQTSGCCGACSNKNSCEKQIEHSA